MATSRQKRGDTRLRVERICDFLDAAYDLESDDDRWLAHVLATASAVWGRNAAVHGAIYDASDVTALSVEAFQTVELPPEGTRWLQRAAAGFTPTYVATSFRSLLVGNCTRALRTPELVPFLQAMSGLGFPDHYAVNGLDPTGPGVIVVFWNRRVAEPDAGETPILRRLAHHLGAAHRVRRRLRSSRESTIGSAAAELTDGAEAIIDRRRGQIVHAVGAAKQRAAQADLMETVAARDQAHRRTDVDAVTGLRRWTPLTNARWSLVDEGDGARHIVARDNRARVRGLRSLSDRERQVVTHLAIGMSTKEMAYALGIADVTVRVLLARATSKLGARSRSDLLEHPEIRPLRPRA